MQEQSFDTDADVGIMMDYIHILLNNYRLPFPAASPSLVWADCGYNNTVKERTGGGGSQLSDKIMALQDGDKTKLRTQQIVGN